MQSQQKLDKSKPYAIVKPNGIIEFLKYDEPFGSIRLSVFGNNWSYSDQSSAVIDKDENSSGNAFSGSITIPSSDNKYTEFYELISNIEERGYELYYRFRFPENVKLNSYQVSLLLNIEWMKGKSISLIGDETKEIVIPSEYNSSFLANNKINEVRVAKDNPEGFSIEVDKPTVLQVQDNRAYGSSDIELRFCFQGEGEVGAKTAVGKGFKIKYNQPFLMILNEETQPGWNDTSEWFPFVLPWDDAPIDLSFLNEKPAGKHGFLIVKGDQFAFEDGTPIRFWGTCFSASANYPTHEQSEKIARRLAKFGVNIVRTHHADAGWSVPNFFEFDRDNQKDNTQSFDPESLDRYDYLIYCLKREGIYVYLDQLVHRKFKAGDGVDAVDQLDFAAKPYSNFDPKLIELQKKFSHDLWTHVNPYTGIAYKDDPAIALMEFTNENDLFTFKITLEPYRSRLEDMYRKWAKENNVDVGSEPVDFTNYTEPILRFLHEVQRSYYKEMSGYLRSIGVRVPMSGSNWSQNMALLSSLLVNDYTDSHSYWDHPSNRKFSNRLMVGSEANVFAWLSFNRVVGKPFFVSEWDQPWANEWRAEHTLAMASVASFQGWNGLTTYTYRHSTATPIDYLSGEFETFNDPTRFGLFYHASLIFRRGDVTTGKQSVAIKVPQDVVFKSPNPTAWQMQALLASAEKHHIAMALPDAVIKDRVIQSYNQPLIDKDATDVSSDTGELYRSWKDRIGTIDTLRTKAVYGFVGERKLNGLELNVKTPFATIAVSSLTDETIERSSKLLLTAVGRAENTGFKYNITHTKTLDRGHGPILIEPIEAIVKLKTSVPDLVVWAIGSDGERKKRIDARMDDGYLTFSIGRSAETIYYIISQ